VTGCPYERYQDVSEPIVGARGRTNCKGNAAEGGRSGQEITWERMMSPTLDLQPKAFHYDMKLEGAPLQAPGVYPLA